MKARLNGYTITMGSTSPISCAPVRKFRGQQCGVAYAEGFQPCLTWPRIPVTRLLPA